MQFVVFDRRGDSWMKLNTFNSKNWIFWTCSTTHSPSGIWENWASLIQSVSNRSQDAGHHKWLFRPEWKSKGFFTCSAIKYLLADQTSRPRLSNVWCASRNLTAENVNNLRDFHSGRNGHLRWPASCERFGTDWISKAKFWHIPLSNKWRPLNNKSRRKKNVRKNVFECVVLRFKCFATICSHNKCCDASSARPQTRANTAIVPSNRVCIKCKYMPLAVMHTYLYTLNEDYYFIFIPPKKQQKNRFLFASFTNTFLPGSAPAHLTSPVRTPFFYCNFNLLGIKLLYFYVL